jgi:hypothetical protein
MAWRALMDLMNPVEQARRVSLFFDGVLDVKSMVNGVDPTLYRQRK